MSPHPTLVTRCLCLAALACLLLIAAGCGGGDVSGPHTLDALHQSALAVAEGAEPLRAALADATADAVPPKPAR